MYEVELTDLVSCIIEAEKDTPEVVDEFKNLFSFMKPLYDVGYEIYVEEPEIWMTKSAGQIYVTFKLNNN